MRYKKIFKEIAVFDTTKELNTYYKNSIKSTKDIKVSAENLGEFLARDISEQFYLFLVDELLPKNAEPVEAVDEDEDFENIEIDESPEIKKMFKDFLEAYMKGFTIEWKKNYK